MFRRNKKGWLHQPSNRVQFIKPFGRESQLMEGDGGDGGGGGGGGGGEFTAPDSADALAKIVSDAVSEAVSTANTASQEKFDTKAATLLDETKAAKKIAKQFEGLDPDKIKSMLAHFENDEEAQLLADGKVDEVITRRIDKQAAEWADNKVALETSLTEMTTEKDKFKGMYQSKLTDIQIRAEAEKAGVLPTAIADVVRNGMDIFQVDAEGVLVARDSAGELIKTESGILLTTELFIDSLKDSSPHYWPKGEGSGGDGSGAGGSGGSKGSLMERKAAAAARGDMTEFHRLNAEMKKAAAA